MNKLSPSPDRVTAPALSAKEAAWRSAVQPVDRAVSEIERRWGSVARLVELVSPDLAGKYGSAWHKLEEAIASADVKEVAHKGSVVARGLEALEAEAKAGGHEPTDLGVVWHINHEKVDYAIVQHMSDVRAAAERFPKSRVWALEELMRVAVATEAGVFAETAKAIFGGATVVEKRPAGPKLKDIIDPLDDIGAAELNATADMRKPTAPVMAPSVDEDDW